MIDKETIRQTDRKSPAINFYNQSNCKKINHQICERVRYQRRENKIEIDHLNYIFRELIYAICVEVSMFVGIYLN